jgi:hypothetical protein
VTSLLAWLGIKRLMGLRVSAEHEIAGLDVSEMGMEAYPEDSEIDGDVSLAPAPTTASPAAPTT